MDVARSLAAPSVAGAQPDRALLGERTALDGELTDSLAHADALSIGSGAWGDAVADSGDAAVSISAESASTLSSAVSEPAVPLFASVMSYPADSVLYLLQMIHTSLGVPWWVSIVGLTACMRLCLFPLNLEAMRVSAALAKAAPELAAMQGRLQAAVGAGRSEAELRALQAEMLSIYRRHNVSPLSAFKLPLVQLPLFLSAIAGLQKAGAVFPSMATGGPAGFANLAAADPSYVLPVLTSATMLVAIEAAMVTMPPAADETAARTQRLMKTVLRCVSVASFPVMANLPQGLLLYWVANNSLTLLQTGLLRIPAVRHALALPEPPDPAALRAAAARLAAASGSGLEGAHPPLPAWAAAGGGAVHAQALRLLEVSGALQRQGEHDGALAVLRQALRLTEEAEQQGAAVHAEPPAGAGSAAGAHEGAAREAGGAGEAGAPAAPPGARAEAGAQAGVGQHVRSLRVQLAQQLVRMGRWEEAEAESTRAIADSEAAVAADSAGGVGAGPLSLERVRALVALGDALGGQGEARRLDAADAYARALDAACVPGGIGYGHELVMHALLRKDALSRTSGGDGTAS